VPTRAQSRQLDGNVPARNAEIVRRLVEAGAMLVGKLTTHEFAFGTPSWGPPGPPALNPWDPARFAGGSSSGAAVAAATGMVLGAIGTDTAGSVRSPAALCGVAGLKPTRARLDSDGVFPLAQSLDTVGVLAWTVEDCATLFANLTPHPETGVPWLSPDRFPLFDADLRGLRIGVVRHFFEKDAPVSVDGATAIDDALDVFRAIGCQVRDVVLPPLAEWNAVGMIILLAEAFAVHERWLRERGSLYGDQVREPLMLGALIDAADYLEAKEHRVRLAATLDATFEKHDLLLTAIQPGEAAAIDTVAKWGFLDRPSYGIPFNVSDNPALSVCCGFGRQGLPLAVQLVARRNDELTLLKAGHAYERTAGWRRSRPPPGSGAIAASAVI
jgi:aspartyl-tRNA(Asn)/glutamyl-tRNA(Gln) amidotransferase subunit A